MQLQAKDQDMREKEFAHDISIYHGFMCLKQHFELKMHDLFSVDRLILHIGNKFLKEY